MRNRMALCLAAGLVLAASALAQTKVEVQPVKKLVPTGSLGTCGYVPTEQERTFFSKLSVKDQATGSFLEDYRIRGRKQKYVSWFGIVRGITLPKGPGNAAELLLEHKYFDSMTDCHIMLVSMSGSGDFVARLQADPGNISALSLVRVYGTVVEEKDGVPVLEAQYVRVWPWLTFTFTDLGAKDRSNPRWKKECKLCSGKRVYNPYPDEQYYRDTLGDPGKYGTALPSSN